MVALDMPALRPTGLMERFMIVRHHVGFDNNIGVSATYRLPRSMLPSQDVASVESLLGAALVQVVKHHPILGVAIEDDASPSPQWQRLASVKTVEVLRVVLGEDFADGDAVVQAEHREFLDGAEKRPLWKVVAICHDLHDQHSPTLSMTLGFYFHHAIADGMSGAAFQLTFLDALNNLLDNPMALPSAADGIIDFPVLDLVPSLEMATPLPITVWFMLKLLFAEYIYSPIDPKSWHGPPIAGPKVSRPAPSCHLSFSLSSAIVDKLLSRCRQEETTLTSLINVLIARTLVERYGNEYSRFSCTTPFSLRKFSSSLTNRDMGCFVSSTIQTFSSDLKPARGHISCRDSVPITASDTTLWSSARAYKQALAAATATPADQSVGMLKFVANDLKSFFLSKLGRNRESAFEVSNIGVVDGGLDGSGEEKDAKRVTFGSVLFSGTPNTYSCPYFFSVASAKRGDMIVTLNWGEGIVSLEDAQNMQAQLKDGLSIIASN